MELKDTIIDLSYAKKLKKLGLPQNSMFNYFECGVGDFKGNIKIVPKGTCIKTIGEYYSAFTPNELMEILPEKITDYKYENVYILTINKIQSDYCAYYDTEYEVRNCSDGFYRLFCGKKMSSSLAQLLIWCIEKGYVEI